MDISAILIMLIVLSILFLYTWCTAPKEELANFFKLWGVIFIVAFRCLLWVTLEKRVSFR